MNRRNNEAGNFSFSCNLPSARLHGRGVILSFLALLFISMPLPALAQSHACHGPPDCLTPGTVCLNGTVFAGCAPDAYYPLFATRCDAGQTYSGSCTGTRTTLPWNNGNTTGYTSPSTNERNGKTNTDNIIAADSDSGVGGTQPHQAAQYCADLVIHGLDDWYLPSLSEARILYAHLTAIGGFTTVNYSTSTGKTSSDLMRMDASNGNTGTLGKSTAANIRCIRRN